MSEYEQIIDEIVKHGVVINVNKIVDDNYINHERKYVGCVVELDFTEHDKVFEDKIASLEENVGYYKDSLSRVEKNCDKLYHENKELKQRIAELESKETEILSEIDTSSPLACAESLIDHMTHCEKFMIMPERDVQTFSVEELKEIADYLMVYYKHHKDRDAEDTISF